MSAPLGEVDITIPEGSQAGDVLSIEVNGKMLEVPRIAETLETLSPLFSYLCARTSLNYD